MRLLKSALGLALAATGGTVAAAQPALADTAGLPHAVGGFAAPTTRVNAKTPSMRAMDVLPDSASLVTNLPPVGDQGQISSCVAWTIAHSIMGYYAKRDGGTGAPYAPLYLYMRSVAKGGAPNAGLNPAATLQEATANGVDTQDDYIQGIYGYQTAPTAAEIANAANYKLSGWTTLWTGDRQGDKAKTAIKTAIAAGSPVAIGMPVFKDFMYLRGDTLYNTITGSSLGGHMITAYAYDADGIWIRNQWGTGWGASGDAHLSWSFVTTDVQAAYTVGGVKTPEKAVVPAPAVTSLSVVRGPVAGGTQVVVNGANLASATAVTFGGVAAKFTKAEANGVTTLTATAPAHTKGIVDVTVTNATGTSALNALAKYTYVPAAPAVTKLSASSSSTAGGDVITVTGTDFTEASVVKLGAAAVAGFKVVAPTTLTFPVPAGLAAGGYDVTVTTPYGTSTAVPAGRLTLVAPPAPTVSALSVNSGSTIAPTTVTVTGTGFGSLKAVTAGGVAVPFTRLSDTQLTVTMPIHAAGKVTLKLTNAGGSFEANALPFTYVAPAVPTVATLSPNAGGTKISTTVTLTGANLGGATKVTVNGAVVSFTKISDTQLKIVLPPHAAGAATVQVTTPGGTSAAAAAATFTYKV
ncbi:IPT/TIG domain-containing protein [Dactylosporangium vinaceum]|uniref:IPT/TIG domain-containing protein n=1 Tax=Dactylosporangium vinaceum TaxID=53362 RepID=A0ABV5M4G1_9ACTN|nr:IPT/TIG domain-containing protein [Dactylosporangium vinaceum]UAB96173.1 IPT/TIG domain-containing protein [Dactylosporangium vinaceum]